MSSAYYKSPIGTAKITGDQDGIQSINIIEDDIETSNNVPVCLQDCVSQLEEYFTKNRKNFNLKLNPKGTEFQQKVWKELQEIPFGKTTTYLQQSKNLGNIKAIRAVASANGKNPLCIVIPCHRVIGSDGSLTGYAGGIWRKKWLLQHENALKQHSLF
ncbi:methylated-DNA--[protein]-cysteine S-methyltransferase [Polaribacter sp.]|nr:methylated-DNA--[protein]-cysteine S-methyltransferase [Polaribacter sp.]